MFQLVGRHLEHLEQNNLRRVRMFQVFQVRFRQLEHVNSFVFYRVATVPSVPTEKTGSRTLQGRPGSAPEVFGSFPDLRCVRVYRLRLSGSYAQFFRVTNCFGVTGLPGDGWLPRRCGGSHSALEPDRAASGPHALPQWAFFRRMVQSLACSPSRSRLIWWYRSTAGAPSLPIRWAEMVTLRTFSDSASSSVAAISANRSSRSFAASKSPSRLLASCMISPCASAPNCIRLQAACHLTVRSGDRMAAAYHVNHPPVLGGRGKATL